MSFSHIMHIFETRPAFLLAALLICGVIFVNGWTDAPGAITASVSTGALKMKNAAILSAVFNFIGALTMGIINPSVMHSVAEITMLIDQNENSLVILCAAMMSIILWAIAAWFFGIPTSESHALISGILGAALAANADITAESIYVLKLALVGLFLSVPIGFLFAMIVSKTIKAVSFNTISNKKNLIAKRGQIIGAAAMSFMHGAQDSQKFAGVFVAALCMCSAKTNAENAPAWLTVFCSLIIASGTAVGGYRIIKKLGMDTVSLTPRKGLAADISASVCMFAASVGGIPVSTTHTSCASVVGAGLSDGNDKANLSSLKEIVLAWILTFPCCGALSYVLVKIFLAYII